MKSAPVKSTISLDDLAKLDVRVRTIKSVDGVSTSLRGEWLARFPKVCCSISAIPTASFQYWQYRNGPFRMVRRPGRGSACV
jgi:hypothetical protein